MLSVSQSDQRGKPLGGRYQVIEKLGAGGFGQTFVAQDIHLPGHPRCVLKKLKPQVTDEESLQTARRLFDTEAQVLYQLGNHDQIPRLLAHFEENEEFYLAQEFIEGKPLSDELSSTQTWSEGKVISLLQDILQVLAFVHQQNVIHRDIKPPNLMRRRGDGKIVLIDFGAVKQVSAQLVNPETGHTDLTISIGTKGYMPNEQIAGKPRFSSDVYAVGIICVQALTGIHPKHIKEDPDSGELNWHEHAKWVSPEVRQIVDQMVRYDFRDRYPTAVEALSALQNLPPAILESVPPPQLLPKEIVETPTGQVKSPVNNEASTELELDLATATGETVQSELDLPSTKIWQSPNSDPNIPTTETLPSQNPSATNPTNPNKTEITVCLSPPAPSPPATATSTSSTPVPANRWLVLALVISVSVILLGVLILLSPQLTRYISQTKEEPSPSPSPTPTPTPSPTSSPKPTAESLLSEAEKLRQTSKYQQAIEVYEQAIALKPELPKAYWGRCYSLNKLGNSAEALVACNDALAFNPNYPEALVSKADALKQQKLPIQALELYEKATKAKPNFAEGWVKLGIALQDVGRSAEALVALDKAISLQRNSADAWSTRGKALWNLKRFDEAIPSLDKALEIEPDHPEALKLRKQAKEKLGR